MAAWLVCRMDCAGKARLFRVARFVKVIVMHAFRVALARATFAGRVEVNVTPKKTLVQRGRVVGK